MNSNFKYLLFSTLLTSNLLYAETSVYGFNQNSVQEQSKPTFNAQKKIKKLERKIARQKERIDGLTTIVEGLSASVHDLELRKNYSANQGGASLKILARKVDTIETNYVTKNALKKALGKKYIPSASKSSVKSVISNDLSNKSSSTLYSEGRRLYGKKRYDEARKRFELTDAKGYKAAASNYYLGEIAYYKKEYKDAIFNFKKSAGLDDQTGYLGTLLLHTAISLEKSGDKEQARAFYDNIITNFEGQKVARIAKSKLKKL